MKLSSEYVGRHCKPLVTKVNLRHAMNYAASIYDANPFYFDDTRPEGVIATPMLAVALTWPISERFDEFWETSDFPGEVLKRQVHYSESIRWMRPLIPGEELVIEGLIRAILPHRGGTHLVLEYTAQDRQGEIVFIERIGGLLRGVGCSDTGRGKEGLDLIQEYDAEEEISWESEFFIDSLDAHRYDAGADMHFPIHTSGAFARSVGLPGIIYHGTATLSLAVREVINRESEADPRRIAGAQCLFTGMVLPGTSVTIQLVAKEDRGDIVRNHFRVLNHEGKTAIRGGVVDLVKQ